MARNFNGSTDKLLIASVPFSSVPMTIAGWARPDGVGERGLAGMSGSVPFARIGLDSSGKAIAQFRNNDQSVDLKSTGTTTLSTTAYQHICGTFAATGTEIFYNGASEDSDATAGNTTITVVQTEIGVLERSSPIQFWDGDIAEVAIWNVILTDDEIATLAKGYSAMLIRPGSLRLYLDLVRGVTDRRGLTFTATGTTVVAHPRIIMPKKRQAWAVAAGGAPAATRRYSLATLGVG